MNIIVICEYAHFEYLPRVELLGHSLGIYLTLLISWDFESLYRALNICNIKF